MSYTINKLGASDITVEYGTLNTETSLQLVGKDYFGYGEAIAQNFVDLLENFASDNVNAGPANPIEGQLWYHSSAETLKIWDGVKWSGTDASDNTVKDDQNKMHHVFIINATDWSVNLFLDKFEPLVNLLNNGPESILEVSIQFLIVTTGQYLELSK
mgnify:CR=1 FL=1